MNMEPTVSVVIPVYNDEDYLRQSMDSLVHQSYKNIEILCVDDGSTDASPAILDEYAARDDRVKVLRHETNRGTLLARKTGVANSAGAWLMFLDGDDHYHPDAVLNALRWAEAEDADILQFAGAPVFDGGEESDWYTRALLPHDAALDGCEAILDSFFVRENNNTLLAGKIFRGELCRRAFSLLPDTYGVMGEDAVAFFFTVLLAEKYRGVDGQKLFFYYVGRGISSHERIGLRKFREYCRMGELTRAVKAYLDANDAGEYRYEAWEKLCGRLSRDCFRAYRDRLDDGDKDAGLLLIGEFWHNCTAVNENAKMFLGLSMSEIKGKYRASLFGGGEGPLVSVVIPVYNAENYLCQCLDSVIGQTLRDIEIICVDDGSTDGSPEILRRFEEKDGRVRVLRQKNLFAGAARNSGIEAARGKYLVFLDADDFFEPDLLEKQVRRCEETGAEICVCGAEMYDTSTGKTTPMTWALAKEYLTGPVFSYTDVKDGLFFFTTPAPWNKIFRADFIRETGLRFQNTRQTNDAYFVLCALNLAECISFVDEALVHYRVGTGANLQANNDKAPTDFLRAFDAVREKLIREGLYRQRKNAFTDLYCSICAHNLSTLRQNETARRSLAEILKTQVVPRLAKDAGESSLVQMENYGRLAFRLYGSEYARVSVVVPIYNTAPWLRRCLDSLTGQTLWELQIVCVIDGSTDESESIAREYASHDERILVVRQENRGLSAARNVGVAHAKGKYLIFVDSDDDIEPDALRYLYQEAERDALELLLFDGATCFESDEVRAALPESDYCVRGREYGEVYSGEALYERMRRENTFRPMACLQLLNREFFLRAGLSFREGIIHEDELFSAQAMLAAKRVSHRASQLYHYFRRGDSITVRKKTMLTVYSLFVTMTGLVDLLENKATQAETRRSTAWFIRFLRERIVREYGELSETTDQKLPPMTELQKLAFAEALGEEHAWTLPEPVTPEDRECRSYLLRGHRYGAAGVPPYTRLAALRQTGSFSPDVSVIIPVYDTAECLPACLDSAVGQTMKNLEFICVNDGSSDESLDIIERYARQDPRITVISQANRGLSCARNAGLEAARGEYVCFLDSDDMLRRDALERLYPTAKQNGLDQLFFDAETVFDREELKKRYLSYDRYYRSGVTELRIDGGAALFAALEREGIYRSSACLQLLRREYLDRVALRFEPGILHEDNLFTFLCTLQSERSGKLGDALYIRRMREDSIMTRSVSFRNVYGYLRCGIGMTEYLKTALCPDEVSRAGYELAETVFKQAGRSYRQLSPEEKEKRASLTNEERFWLDCVL